jgi:hypothetical protein
MLSKMKTSSYKLFFVISLIAFVSKQTNADIIFDDWYRDDDVTPCQVSQSGVFGSTKNIEPAILRYGYTLTYLKDADIDGILIDLETAISNSVLSSTSIFPECALATGTSDQSSIIGLSSEPKDKAKSNDCSQVGDTRESLCVLVDGGLSLYYKQDKSRRRLQNEIENEIINTINDGMKDGSLLSANSNILGLSYIDGASISGSTTSSEEEEDEEPSLPRSRLTASNITFILVASCGAVAITALTAISYKKYKKRQSRIFMEDESIDESTFNVTIQKTNSSRSRRNRGLNSTRAIDMVAMDDESSCESSCSSYGYKCNPPNANTMVYPSTSYCNSELDYNETFDDNPAHLSSNTGILYDISFEDDPSVLTSSPIGARFADQDSTTDAETPWDERQIM